MFQTVSTYLHFSIWTLDQMIHQEKTSSSQCQTERWATELRSSQFISSFGHCIRENAFCEICASPKWIEIYLKLLLFVQKHVQSIFVFSADICIYEFVYLNII